MTYIKHPEYGETIELEDVPPQALRIGYPPKRNVAPNWGRSYPLRTLYGSSEQEVARVELSRPVDMTVMLGDVSSTFVVGKFSMPTCSIQYGVGGTANQTILTPSSRGTIYHVVAQSVVVRGSIPVGEGSFFPEQARFQAMVGLGRPSRQQWTQTVDLVTAGGEQPVIRLLPWVIAVSIEPMYGPTPPTLIASVQWATALEGSPLDTELGIPITDFATPKSPPQLWNNAITFSNPVGADGFTAIVTQYWDL